MMDSFELMIFLFSGYYAIKGIINWYIRLAGIWPPWQNKTVKYVFGILPAISFIIIIYTLKAFASFDVVNDFTYIVFYLFLGFAWVFFGLKLVAIFFDISWIDDVVSLNNKSALFAVTGAFLGLTAIYSGANIGDGPGWWCVLFAGGLGLISWLILGVVIHFYTQVCERITVERDIYCGIRFGTYLIAGGIILGRASAGDWTSFSMTIVEFFAGWPVLLLSLLAIIVEKYHIQKAKAGEDATTSELYGSILWGIIYIIIAVVSIILIPLPENPAYGNMTSGLSGGVL